MQRVSGLNRVAAGSLLAVGCTLLSWIMLQLPFVQSLERKTVDLRFQLLTQPVKSSSDIVIVEIDDSSIKDLEPAIGRWPWPREAHAVFLDFMTHARAKLVVFDIQFTERDLQNPEADEVFAEATAIAGNVIHAIAPNVQHTDSPPLPELLERVSIPATGGFFEYPEAIFPYPELARSARGMGHVGIVLDPDGPQRRSPLLIAYQDRLIPSLSLAAALAVRDYPIDSLAVKDHVVSAGDIRVPFEEDGMMPIWFNGGPGTYTVDWSGDGQQFHGFKYSHIIFSQSQIEQELSPLVDPALFENKIVMVGVTAGGLHDLFTTPYAGAFSQTEKGFGKMAGVEVHANILDNLLHNRYLIRTPGWLDWTLTLFFAVGVIAAVFYSRLLIAAALSLLTLGAYFWISLLVFSRQRQLPVVPVVISWSLALALGLAYQYWFEGAEKRKVKKIFSHYVSKDVYQQLLDNPEATALGGKRSLVTVFFSDIRGFTSISEASRPEDLVEQLNEYFSAMVEIVFRYKGTIDKFVGDMIMALFNAPLPDEEHADHAVQCAIDMNRKLVEMNAAWQAEGRPELHCGVGINTGDMVAGNIGAETIRSYTVIGDNVNLGSRLESLCKEYQSEIIISESTLAHLNHSYPMQGLGEVQVKGKSSAIKIYRIFYEPDAVSRADIEEKRVMTKK